MFCPECGSKVEEKEKFCAACGAPLGEDVNAETRGRFINWFKKTPEGQVILLLVGILFFSFSIYALLQPAEVPQKTEEQAPREEIKEEEVEEGQLQKSEPEQPPEPQSIALSGKGQQATQKFTLENGLSIFEMAHSGQSNFIVSLLDEEGNEVGFSLANEIGSFNGSKAMNIAKGGTYLLNIQADGNWQITIRQPRPVDAPATTQFSGTSQKATDLFSLSKGMKIFKMSHSGESNFIVQLLDKSGKDVSSSLVNEIGKFNGSKAVKIETSDIYILDVAADGDWSISIE